MNLLSHYDRKHTILTCICQFSPKEKLQSSLECDVCFICMQNSRFHLHRYRLIELQTCICSVSHISNIYMVLNKNPAFSRLAPVSYQGAVFLNFMFLILGFNCNYNSWCNCSVDNNLCKCKMIASLVTRLLRRQLRHWRNGHDLAFTLKCTIPPHISRNDF